MTAAAANMPALRWALLLIGVAFLAVLALWELRRARRNAPSRNAAPPAQPEPGAGHVHREPTLTLPEIRTREPRLPVIEVPDEEPMLGLRVDGQREEELGSEDGLGALEEGLEPILPTPAAPAASSGGMTGELAAPEPATDPVVDWPDESVRQVIALRLIASPGERFPGRAVRQALAAEGFVLGRFAIFHRAGPDGRALVSAASLTQPGTFDRAAMDMQRLGGLNLLTVLPGALSPADAFDELLASARGLNGRLEGALHDQYGEPLTSARAAEIRDELLAAGEPPSAPADAAHAPPGH